MGETASRSRSMLSNPRMSFRVASGNDVHSSVFGTFVSAVIRGGCPPRLPSLRIKCLQPSGPPDQPKQALPADNRRAHIRLSNDPCTMTNRLKQPCGQASRARMSSASTVVPNALPSSSTLENSLAFLAFSAMTFSSMVSLATRR